MSSKFYKLNDIRKFFLNELKDLYPESEITAITNLILKTQFAVNRLHMLIEPDRIISEQNFKRVITICSELKTGKPIQYILGETVFYDCVIKLNNETLIPRPETEELADLIIRENKDFGGRITDLGTGTGCIAIALKKNLPLAQVTGIDNSEKALEMAVTNAILNNVAVTFSKSDIFEFNADTISSSDIIVSNPPYVLESEKKYMMSNILDFEPHSALFVPDDNPLLFYGAILEISKTNLVPGGRIYFEINESKGLEMKLLLESYSFSHVEIINDINGKNRIIKGRKNG